MPIEALIALVSLAAGLVADRRSSDETRANEGPSDDLVSRDMIPQAVMSRAREMLDHYGSRPMLCGDSVVVSGWWIESHTLGCRNQADEPEEEWGSSHQTILRESEDSPTTVVLGPVGDHDVFVTVHPLGPELERIGISVQ
jgi:hypothetical protein